MELLYYFLSIISIFTLAIYVLMMTNYIIKWNTIENFDLQNHPATFATTVSIIVAARNEEENILSLLKCLFDQNYPVSLLEIIIVDDHSEDDTAQLVTDFIKKKNTSIIKLIQLYKINPELKNKKAAIQQGIQHSTGALIVTTDADCTMGTNWIRTIVSYYELNECEMIVAPVLLTGHSFFQRVQQIEFLSLIAVTASSVKNHKPLMCNGANLAYSRKIFLEVGGFDNNRSIASGDDTFLMFKVAKLNPLIIHFLKSTQAAVKTPAQKSIASFMQQRIRWASKTTSYKLPYISFTGYLIAALNILLLVISLLSFADQKFLIELGILFSVKFIFDAFFLSKLFVFFRINQPVNYILVFITALIYPIYILIITYRSLNARYTWKGRFTSNFN